MGGKSRQTRDPRELGARISLLGGGGKTTLGRALSRATGLPHIELDALHHLPNWAERDRDDFRSVVAAALEDATDGWIADGSYSGKLHDMVTGQADTVIFLNMPWRVMFRRILVREFRRAHDGKPVCGENVVTWRRALSRESLWWYHVQTRRAYLDRPNRLKDRVPASTPIVELRSPRELNAFYATYGLTRS